MSEYGTRLFYCGSRARMETHVRQVQKFLTSSAGKRKYFITRLSWCVKAATISTCFCHMTVQVNISGWAIKMKFLQSTKNFYSQYPENSPATILSYILLQTHYTELTTFTLPMLSVDDPDWLVGWLVLPPINHHCRLFNSKFCLHKHTHTHIYIYIYMIQILPMQSIFYLCFQ